MLGHLRDGRPVRPRLHAGVVDIGNIVVANIHPRKQGSPHLAADPDPTRLRANLGHTSDLW